MALKRNGRDVFYNNPGKYLGATSLQSGNFIKGGLNSRSFGGFSGKFSAYPNGALASSSFILPQKTGSISSYTRSRASLSTSANGVPSMPMQATASMTILATSAQLDQVIQLIASGVMSLTGSASLAAAISAQAASSVTLTGSAQLGGIVPITANGSATLLSNAVMSALAYMTAEAGGPTPLSPEGLANAVWDAVLADHSSPGTTGYALSSMSGGSSPTTIAEAVWDDPRALSTAKFSGLK